MVHVFLRIAVWVLVLGIGYLILGPDLFDSSRDENPFESRAQLYLPPAKSQRQIEYEQVATERPLSAEEAAAYRELVDDRSARFWQGDGLSVEEALAGVKQQRKQRLAEILAERGLTPEEISVFLFVVERDNPALLADQQ